MAAKSGATAASSRFPISVSAHCALIALVLALAIFRFFLTGQSTSGPVWSGIRSGNG